MKGIDEKYEKVKAFLTELEQINKQFREEQAITKDYLSPFNQEYQLKTLIEKIREDLIAFVIDSYTARYCPNITIDKAKIRGELNSKYGNLGFDSGFIEDYIKKNYLSNAEELSYKEILHESRKLLPVFWNHYERREPRIEDIQQKNKLILKLYLDSYHSEYKQLAAIEKLIKIIADKQNPITVRADRLTKTYWDLRGEALYKTYCIEDKNIEKVRGYKSGKFVIYLKDEQTAKKIAKVLLGH